MMSWTLASCAALAPTESSARATARWTNVRRAPCRQAIGSMPAATAAAPPTPSATPQARMPTNAMARGQGEAPLPALFGCGCWSGGSGCIGTLSMLVMTISFVDGAKRHVDKEANGRTFRAIRPNVKNSEGIRALWRRQALRPRQPGRRARDPESATSMARRSRRRMRPRGLAETDGRGQSFVP